MTNTINTTSITSEQVSFETMCMAPEVVALGIRKDGTQCLVGGYRCTTHQGKDSMSFIRYKEIPVMPSGSFEEIKPKG